MIIGATLRETAVKWLPVLSPDETDLYLAVFADTIDMQVEDDGDPYRATWFLLRAATITADTRPLQPLHYALLATAVSLAENWEVEQSAAELTAQVEDALIGAARASG